MDQCVTVGTTQGGCCTQAGQDGGQCTDMSVAHDGWLNISILRFDWFAYKATSSSGITLLVK
jgi:hypothetical protein